MIQEEQQHIDWVERALAAAPDPNIDWDALFAHRRVVLPPGAGVEIPVRSGKPKARKAGARVPVAKKKAAGRETAKKMRAARRPAPRKKSAARRKPAAKKKAARRR
jgi:hypothetical protein